MSRYLDTSEGEMHWSVPNVGSATRKISYGNAGKTCSYFAFPEPRLTEATPGEIVTINVSNEAYASFHDNGEYFGWTDGSTPSSFSDLHDRKDYGSDYSYALSFKYTFTMPDSDVTVWH